MKEKDLENIDLIFQRICTLLYEEKFRVTQHAQQEMANEDISLDEVKEAIIGGRIIENYHEHRRGACCLISGETLGGRSVHVVCTSNNPILIIITVYRPKMPKWLSSTRRSKL